MAKRWTLKVPHVGMSLAAFRDGTAWKVGGGPGGGGRDGAVVCVAGRRVEQGVRQVG